MFVGTFPPLVGDVGELIVLPVVEVKLWDDLGGLTTRNNNFLKLHDNEKDHYLQPPVHGAGTAGNGTARLSIRPWATAPGTDG